MCESCFCGSWYHGIMVNLVNGYAEVDYETRHRMVNVLDRLCSKSQGEILSQLERFVIEHSSVEFASWILRSIGCHNIKKLAIRSLIEKDGHVQDLVHSFRNSKTRSFVQSFFDALGTTLSQSVSREVKQFCTEYIYQLAHVGEFRHETTGYGISEALIPQLTYRDVVSKRWAVKTLSQSMESPEVVQKLMKEGIIPPAIQCFLRTPFQEPLDILERDVLASICRICAILSDFNSFRTVFENQRGLAQMFQIFDRSHDPILHTLCLRILKAFIINANKEGSGNAALGLLQGRRLRRLIDLTESHDIKAGCMACEVFEAYLTHTISQFQTFGSLSLMVFWNAYAEMKGTTAIYTRRKLLFVQS